MKKNKILGIIEEQIDSLSFFDGNLVSWSENTCEILKRIFGDKHHSARKINNIISSIDYDAEGLFSDLYRNDESSKVQESIIEILNTCLKEYEIQLAHCSNTDDPTPSTLNPYVNQTRIQELRSIGQYNFDLAKLIRLCEELNIASTYEMYYSTAMLVRAILDHIPPIFSKTSFSEVANNHSTKSWKDSMVHLDKSARKIADSHLHTHIRSSESLPNRTQVDSSRDLDVLLGEIVRILKENESKGDRRIM